MSSSYATRNDNYHNSGLSRRTIYKNTLAMAWPTMLESFLVSLTMFMDSMMVSTLGISAVAAIGLSTQPRFLGLCVFVAMATAISAVVARRKGEDDSESANKVLRMSLLVGAAFIVIITLAFLFGTDAIIKFVGSTPQTHGMAVSYLRIVMSGTAFNGLTYIINASQRGAGKTKISMVTNMSANIVNIILNFLLIEGRFGFPALGIEGAAIATVIGSMVGCIVSICTVFKAGEFIYIKSVKGFFASKRDINALTKVGVSALVEQLLLRIGFLLFLVAVANLGTIALGAHQIGMNFMGISFSFADGLAIASVALVGRSLGMGKADLAKAYGIACQRIGLICAMGISFVSIFFGRSLFSLFTDDEQVLAYGNMIMIVLCIVTFLQIQQVTILGSLRGAGDTKYTAFTSLISVSIVRPAASYILCYPLGLGLFGIWMGMFCDQVIRFAMGYIRFRAGKWLTIKL